MNKKEIVKIVEAIKGELAPVKAIAGDAETFTPKVKKHIEDTIDRILSTETELTDESLAIAVDNIVHLIKNTKALSELSKLQFATNKLDKLTHDWIQDIYGKSKTFDRRDKEDIAAAKEKEDAKAAKEDEIKAERNSKTSRYFKLLKDIGDATQKAKQVIDDFKITGDEDVKKELEDKLEDAKQKLPNLERSFKKLRTELSDDMEKEDIVNLLKLVTKVKNTYQRTILSGIVDKVAKKISNYVSVNESEIVSEIILENFAETIDEAKKEKKWNFEKSEEEKEEISDDETSDDTGEKPKKKKKESKEISESYYNKANWIL